MWALLAVLSLSVCLTGAQHFHRYIKIPVAAGHDNECYDPQVDKLYQIGDVWGPQNSNCKQSRCTKEGNQLYIDRISCDPVRDRVDFKRIKEEHLLCRIGSGNRLKPFPGCCPRLVCKYHDPETGRLKRLPEERYPHLYLTNQVEDHFQYAS